MKRIYEFEANKEETVKEESVEKKKDGTEVTTSKDVKKEVPHKFFQWNHLVYSKYFKN